MGATQSHTLGDAPHFGFRVLRVFPKSPACELTVFPDAIAARDGFRQPGQGQLVAFFDVIVSIDGIILDETAFREGVLSSELKGNEGKPVILEVYNVKSNRYRTVQVTPSSCWGGDGLLGVQVKWQEFSRDTMDSVLHVTDVDKASPAALAGLFAEVDFILGTADAVFTSVEGFGEMIAANAGKEVELFVYDGRCDTVRCNTMYIPIEHWVAEASVGLGVTLASGHLHALPNRHTPGRNQHNVPPQQVGL